MGEMGTAHAGKPPSLPRELRTPLVHLSFMACCQVVRQKLMTNCMLKVSLPYNQSIGIKGRRFWFALLTDPFQIGAKIGLHPTGLAIGNHTKDCGTQLSASVR
jgi:hypothetical protein